MALAHELFGNGNHKVMVTNEYAQDTSSNDPIRPHFATLPGQEFPVASWRSYASLQAA